ncbi:MAG: toll/interleukin-1 receptor domain-containing protein [Candidatus Angelobacter sp.]
MTIAEPNERPTDPKKPRYDIFVSYAQHDHRYAKELGEHLKALKTAIEFNFFIDKEELRAGDDLRDTIEHATRTASIFIIVATPYYFSSAWAFPKEFPAVKSAVEESETKKLITLVYEECDFLLEYHRLTRYLVMNLSKGPRRYNRLMSDLHKIMTRIAP